MTTKTLLATALFAALAATSITSQAQTNWYFDYGTSVGTFGKFLTPTNDLAGLVLNEGVLAEFTLNEGAKFSSLTQEQVQDGRTAPVGSASNFSVLIVGGNTVTSASTVTIDTSSASGLTTKAPSLTTFTGIYLQGSDAELSFSANNIAVTLSATGSTGLAGLSLVGLDVSEGGTYTGFGNDTITISSSDASAIGLNVGAGTTNLGTQVTVDDTATVTDDFKGQSIVSQGAIITTGKLLDSATTTQTSLSGTVDFTGTTEGSGLKAAATASGVYMTGAGEVLLKNTNDKTIELAGTVTTVADYTGAAEAYGAYLGAGGTFTATSGVTSTKLTATIESDSDPVEAGSALAAGLSASGEATVTVTGDTALEISGTVGATNGALGNAKAYGVYASGSTIEITAGQTAATITGQVSTESQDAIADEAAQEAAGIYAVNGAKITLNGGENGITIKGSNQNTIATENEDAQINVYGIYANAATLNLNGKIDIELESGEVGENQDGYFNIAGISATDTTTTVIGATTVTEADIVLTGGTLTITGDAEGEAASILKTDTSGDFIANNVTKITLTGATNSADNAAEIDIAGNFTVKNSEILLDAGEGGADAAGANASITIGGEGTITGGSVILKAGVAGTGSSADGGEASISSTGDLTIANVEQFELTGGNAAGENSGGEAKIEVSSAQLTITNSQITVTGGVDDGEGAGTEGEASITAQSLALGTANGTDGSTITLNDNATLSLTNASNAYEGTTVTVQKGATLESGANFTFAEGATLELYQGAEKVTGKTTIEGTLSINGTSEENPYKSGLGEMIVKGEVTPADGSLYLQLLAAASGQDQLTIGEGGSMTAAQVGVGTNTGSGLTAAAKFTVAGGDVTINELTVGSDASADAGTGTVEVSDGNLNVGKLTIAGATNNKVTVSGGYLTVADATSSEEPNLVIGDGGALEVTDGTLVTNSLNLWNLAADTVITPETDPGLQELYQDLVDFQQGGKLELTDKTIETSWLAQAKQDYTDAQFVLDGKLVENGKSLNLMPTAPTTGELPNKGVAFSKYGNLLLANTLNAAPVTTVVEKGQTGVTYQNLIFGASSANSLNIPWSQNAGTQSWTVNMPETTEYGFASIDLGTGETPNTQNILVAGNATLALAGDENGNIVNSNQQEANLYVGTLATTSAGRSAGNLILGYSPTAALGGKLTGNVTVYDGTVLVQYNKTTPYEITGTLTLGQLKTNQYNLTAGSLTVADGGNLTVGAINGQNVGSAEGDTAGISITGTGSTLTVLGDMNVKLATTTSDETDEFEIAAGTLTVQQDLLVSAAGTGNTVVMAVSDGSTVTVGNLTATNTLVGLEGSSMTVNGTFNQATQGKVDPLVLAAIAKSELAVNTDLITTAGVVWVNNSTVSVGNNLTIGQADEGTTEAPETTLILDGATISATNITLNNVVQGTVSTTFAESPDLAELDPYLNYYQSGDITATGNMDLVDSTIQLNSGSLTVNGTLSVNPASSLTLGIADLTEVNKDLEAAEKTALTTMVAEASIEKLSLAGDMAILGVAPATEAVQTEVAIGNLAFNTDATKAADGGTLTVSGAAALMLGSSSISDLEAYVTLLDKKAPDDLEITNYLVAGQSVNMYDFNTVAIGTIGGAEPTAGLTIGDGVAVAVDGKLLASSIQDGKVSLFNYIGSEENAPAAAISQTAYFLVTNPLGNMEINVAGGGFETEGISLYNTRIKWINPLYDYQWKQPEVDPNAPAGANAGDPEEEAVESTIISVTINGDAVRAMGSLAPNSIIDAAGMHYNPNASPDEGANLLLNIIAGVDGSEASYAQAVSQINSIALKGAAAHAHEIGISAASMVVDSVWDHGSKLAAAPHEEAKGDLWITLDWNHSRANDYKAGGLDNGYKLDLYGATFGADYDFANGLAAGLAVSVGGGDAKSKGFNDGQKTDVTYWGINLYGTYASPFVNVIGNVGYIGIKNKTKTVFGKGRPDANIWTIGVKAEKDFAINEQFTVTPHVGIRYLSVDVDDFNLGGFHYGTDKANLVQFPIGVAFAANLKTANGAAVKPFLDLTFVPTAGDKNVNNTFGIQGGTMSDTIDTTIASGAMFQGKIGVNASYGAHNFGLNFAIGGGNKGRLDTGLQAKYRFVF